MSEAEASGERGLADFAGQWELAREIDDRRAGARMTLTGRAVLTPVDRGLLYEERGQLHLPDGQVVSALRRYGWRAQAGRIAVDFEDGRAFHSFDPSGGCAQAEHWCDPDSYAVRYDLSDWPCWSSRWRVEGPRKDYVMTTRYWRG